MRVHLYNCGSYLNRGGGGLVAKSGQLCTLAPAWLLKVWGVSNGTLVCTIRNCFCSLTVCQGLLRGGGVCSGGCQSECVPEGGVSVGGLVPGGIPACIEADPPVNRMTDRCKNITLGTHGGLSKLGQCVH